MDKETDMTETKRQIEVMKAYEEGKTIQYRGKCTKDDVWNDTKFPSWNWYSVDYRVKPDEAKTLMTYRQLSELITKGYGQWFYNYDNAVMGKNTLFIDKEVNENILIRPWGLDKLVRPTMDVYEEFMKRKAASKDSSATVSKEESVEIHKRTPQEIADFFNCYVAMDWNSSWYLYKYEPMLLYSAQKWFCERGGCTAFGSDFNSSAFLFIKIPEDHNWRTLYRPYKEPLVMEEEDD